MYLFWEKTGVRSPGVFEVAWSRIGFALAIIYSGFADDDRWPWMFHVHFLWLNLFIHFPGPAHKEEPAHFGEWLTWGFHCIDRSLCIQRGIKNKYFEWPWAYRFISHEVRRADGSWTEAVESYDHGKGSDGREIRWFSYRYKLKSGTVQERTAEVHVSRRTWRMRWLSWTNLFDLVRPCIEVSFDDEVGERSGSWKGGTVGCGYDMVRGETVEQCLRRMERERIFD